MAKITANKKELEKFTDKLEWFIEQLEQLNCKDETSFEKAEQNIGLAGKLRNSGIMVKKWV